MNPLHRSVVAVFLAVVCAPAGRAADVTDPADLFPPGTLAYAELHDPAALGPELAAVVKGTALADSIAFIHSRRDAAKDARDLVGKDQLAFLGLLASPEMAAEVRKFRGVAVGLTGFNEQGDAEVAGAVLTGDSQAAGLAARALLTMTTVRKVGTLGDVPVYQFRQPAYTFDPNTGQQRLANDKPPTEGTHELTLAYIPGLFVAGTSKAAVGEVVTRFQGKKKGSLAGTPAFKEAAASHRRPGLFFFANAPEFCARYDEARRNEGGTIEPDALGWFRLVANGKAVRYLAGCAWFRDGGVSVTVAGVFDPAHKSPLFDFLAGAGVKVELLHHAPAPATFAVAVTLPEKDRAATVIGLLDAMAKADGELGQLPGEAIKEWEAKYKLSVAAGLIGKTRAVTVLLPAKQEIPKGGRHLPMLVLHTNGPDAAAGWEDFLPKLVAELGHSDPPQPSSETVNGVKVLSLPGGALPWKAAVHYARKDGVFVVGLDRKLVAAAAAGDEAASVVPANGGVAAPADPVAVFGTLGFGGVFRLLTEDTRPDGPVVPITPVTPGTKVRPSEEAPDQANDQKQDESKAWATLLKSLDGLAPAQVAVRRSGSELRVEVWQPKVQGGGLAPVVNAGVGWYDKLLNRNQPGNPRFGRYRGDR
ncbi:MAG: hypothetical protein JWO38_6474 [Gemmataceae bacterium]|nr:hypothetical protein [Gemmataceae bacterium]